MRTGLQTLARCARQYALGVTLLVALILRLISLESRSLQYDDVFSIFLAARSLPEILSGTAADTMPPLYYFLLHYWMLIAQSAWFLRLLSVILSLGAVALLYRLVECWLGREAAGWAAFLAAVSPLLIDHAQEARMYSLLTLSLLGYLWFFSRIWFAAPQSAGRPADWVGLVLCGAAAMYSHNVAIFTLAAPNLFLLIRRDWKLLLRLFAAQAVIGLLALPWLLLIPGQIAKVQKAWTLPRPGVVEILQAVVMLTASLPLPTLLLALALLLSLQIMVMLGLELWRGRRQQAGDRPGVSFWLVVLFLPPGLLLIASYIMRPIFIPRAFMVSALAYDALGGLVIARTWSRGVGKLLALGFVLAALISLPAQYTYNAFPRSPYKQAVQYLSGVVQPGDQIVHETKLSYFPAHFYAPSLAQSFLADPPDSPNNTFEPGSQRAMQLFPQPDLAAAVGESRSVYFITFTQTFKEYQEMGYAGHPNLHWLDQHYRRVDQKVFNDLEIYHYER